MYCVVAQVWQGVFVGDEVFVFFFGYIEAVGVWDGGVVSEEFRFFIGFSFEVYFNDCLRYCFEGYDTLYLAHEVIWIVLFPSHDRVFDVDGQLVVIDLKTSQRTPDSSLQLGFYRAGLKQVFGVDINWGNYWMARQSGTGSMVDISKYTDEMIDYFVDNFDRARRAGIFLPNTNNCNRCGLTEFCPFTSKKEKQ